MIHQTLFNSIIQLFIQCRNCFNDFQTNLRYLIFSSLGTHKTFLPGQGKLRGRKLECFNLTSSVHVLLSIFYAYFGHILPYVFPDLILIFPDFISVNLDIERKTSGWDLDTLAFSILSQFCSYFLQEVTSLYPDFILLFSG